MNAPIEGNANLRRAARAKARQSRRPSRLGMPAGTTPKPDRVFVDDAGFPGLLTGVWRDSTSAPSLSVATDTLLTLGGHVPADIQLRALRVTEECALKVLYGVTWREEGRYRCRDIVFTQRPPFVGELGLTISGRVVMSVPSQGLLATEESLVDTPMRVPWTVQALSAYRDELSHAAAAHSRSVLDCRAWLAALGDSGKRDDILERLKDAARRTAPFLFYQDGRQYTNFRQRNNLPGKTLWPGHPDCALTSLQGMPLDLWSDHDAVMVVCLNLLVRSGGFARIEEVNGTQLTVDHVAYILDRSRRTYDRVDGERRVATAGSHRINALYELAARLHEQRAEISGRVQLHREIHGPLMHKIERVAGPPAGAARHREVDLCATLRSRLPISGETIDELGARLAESPGWLSQPAGAFGSGLESLVYETVSAATTAFAADFAMSRGMRSLPHSFGPCETKTGPGSFSGSCPSTSAAWCRRTRRDATSRTPPRVWLTLPGRSRPGCSTTPGTSLPEI